MSRRDATGDSSLELLLDTICNTFGGVLFISMLVLTKLNSASRDAAMAPPGEASQAELIKWEHRLAQASYELNRLQGILSEQQKTERYIMAPQLADMVRGVHQAQSENALLLEQKTTTLSQLARSQKEINRISQTLQESSVNIQKSQEKLEAIERLLQQEIAARTRAAKLPKVRRTGKTEVVLFVRNGRLSSYTKAGPEGTLVPNVAEFVEKKDENNNAYVEPKPGAGTAIALRGANVDAVDRRLDEFNSTEHFLAIFVWPDSFEQFAVVKDRMVSRQFEYRLVPFPDDEKIYIGPAPAHPENREVQ